MKKLNEFFWRLFYLFDINRFNDHAALFKSASNCINSFLFSLASIGGEMLSCVVVRSHFDEFLLKADDIESIILGRVIFHLMNM